MIPGLLLYIDNSNGIPTFPGITHAGHPGISTIMYSVSSSKCTTSPLYSPQILHSSVHPQKESDDFAALCSLPNYKKVVCHFLVLHHYGMVVMSTTETSTSSRFCQLVKPLNIQMRVGIYAQARNWSG